MSKKKAPRVREARPEERNLFRQMWWEMMQDQHKKGWKIELTERNLDTFCNLFDNYVSGKFEGVVLFIGYDAVTMCGSLGEPPFDTSWGKTANGWGTYVREGARRKGLGRRIREVCIEKMKAKGFDTLIGEAVAGNKVGFDSGIALGFKPHSVVVSMDLRERDKETQGDE